jgi:trans-2,3-dihydro-3-hydroxyanthranilate isomerase
MALYPFMQVDAFTDAPLAGNPCAVVFDGTPLDDEMMLAIAREMNLSETAFVFPSENASFAVRYFTPAEEIPMAGHPTLATTFALIDSGRLKLAGDYTQITLELKVGVLPVEIFAHDGDVERIVMTQKPPQFMATYDPAVILPLFNLTADDALPDMPIQTVSTGTPQLMIPLRSHEALRRAQMNVAAYAEFRQQADFFSPHLFCVGGISSEAATFARHFGTPPDTMEDPFTGSATGGMAAYLWHYGLIDVPQFIAEQGHWMSRPGRGFVEVLGTRDTIETVKVGGGAVVVLRGTLSI